MVQIWRDSSGVVVGSMSATGVMKAVRLEGNFFGNITGNAASATTATNLAGGAANQIPYQSAPGATTFTAAPGANAVLFANGAAPQWTNTPTLTGTNITAVASLANTAAAGNSAVTAINAGSNTINWARVNKTGSNLTDLATRSHTVLSDIGTNSHAAIDVHISSTAAHFASDQNLPSRIVVRDASGNFSAGTVTAYLIGNVTGNITGNAAGTAAAVPWTGITGKPTWMQAQNLVATLANTHTPVPSGFYEANAGTDYPTAGTRYSLLNVRHSNTTNEHGFMIAASYWSDDFYTRVYNGGDGTGTGTYTTWRRLVREQGGINWGIDISGTAATATNLAGGMAGQIPYQTTPGVTSFIADGTANYLLKSNGGTSAPSWTNAPTISGANITGLPWAGVLKTGSSLADIANHSHTVLTDIGTNSHATIDTHLAATSAHGATSAGGAGSYNRIVLRDGAGGFTAGTITATFIGNLTGNVTGNVSGTAASAPPTGAAGGVLSGTYPNPGFANNASYPVAFHSDNGIKFWNGSDNYKISLGSGTNFGYGPVTDYAIKMQMDSTAGRGFSWGKTGQPPTAALSTGGDFTVYGYISAAQVRVDAANSIPVHKEVIYGSGGDLPFHTTSTGWVTMRYVYGPFSYSMISCPSGATRYHRAFAEFVDNITSGGQSVQVQLAFDGGATRLWDMGGTGGGSPSYRTWLSGTFTESNTNHANVQVHINGSAGPFVEIRRVEIWTYCAN